VESKTFWSQNQVGGPYTSLRASAQALAHRHMMYPDLYKLMPVNMPGKVVLDYGCGPGHDVVLFLSNKAEHVYYYDVSPMSLNNILPRIDMHGLDPTRATLFTPGVRVDHIHCSGVLHHMEDPMGALDLFARTLKPHGTARVMIYDGDTSEHTQSSVPITRWWTQDEFRRMCKDAGMVAEFLGTYPCSAPWRPNCNASCWELTGAKGG
jgi:ubiquinone/menaquinone biosynthesis C-methylase UbiE